MNITIDIGNTFIKLCVFQDDKIVFQDRKKIFFEEDFIKLANKYQTKKAIISSVRDNNTEIETYLLRAGIKFYTLNTNTPLPINIEYDTPHTLGQDRVAAAVGANFLIKDSNLIIIDLGTCITYDFLKGNKTFIGGNIAPGHKMRLDAMAHFTKKLPKIEIDDSELPKIGNNTVNAMRAGAYYGIINEINGVINDARQTFNNEFSIVITGGGAADFIKDLKFKHTIEPNLVHIGLNNILDKIDENKL